MDEQSPNQLALTMGTNDYIIINDSTELALTIREKLPNSFFPLQG